MAAASKHHHDLLKIGAAGAVAVAAYEWLYKPWKNAQAIAATGTGAATPSLIPSLFNPGSIPSPAAMVTTPTSIQPSNLNPGALVGGVVGACMSKKNWTQQQCQDRLNALSAAYLNGTAAISQLKANTSNPAAAGIAAANQQLLQEIAARDSAIQQASITKNAGDTAGAAIWNAAVAAHNQDIAELQSRISVAGSPIDNSGAIATYQGQLAALDANYFALTGVHLAS